MVTMVDIADMGNNTTIIEVGIFKMFQQDYGNGLFKYITFYILLCKSNAKMEKRNEKVNTIKWMLNVPLYCIKKIVMKNEKEEERIYI